MSLVIDGVPRQPMWLSPHGDMRGLRQIGKLSIQQRMVSEEWSINLDRTDKRNKLRWDPYLVNDGLIPICGLDVLTPLGLGEMLNLNPSMHLPDFHLGQGVVCVEIPCNHPWSIALMNYPSCKFSQDTIGVGHGSLVLVVGWLAVGDSNSDPSSFNTRGCNLQSSGFPQFLRETGCEWPDWMMRQNSDPCTFASNAIFAVSERGCRVTWDKPELASPTTERSLEFPDTCVCEVGFTGGPQSIELGIVEMSSALCKIPPPLKVPTTGPGNAASPSLARWHQMTKSLTKVKDVLPWHCLPGVTTGWWEAVSLLVCRIRPLADSKSLGQALIHKANPASTMQWMKRTQNQGIMEGSSPHSPENSAWPWMKSMNILQQQ